MKFNIKKHKEEINKTTNSFFEIVSKNSKKELYNILDNDFKKNIGFKKFSIFPKYELSLGKLENVKIENINKKTKRAVVRVTFLNKGVSHDKNIYLVYQDKDWKIDGEMLFRE